MPYTRSDAITLVASGVVSFLFGIATVFGGRLFLLGLPGPLLITVGMTGLCLPSALDALAGRKGVSLAAHIVAWTSAAFGIGLCVLFVGWAITG